MSLVLRQPSPQNNEDEYVSSYYIEAIIFDSFESLTHHDSKTEARKRLIGQASKITVGQCGENIVYGNEKGHEILATLEEHGEDLKRQREALKRQREALKRQREALERQKKITADLQERADQDERQLKLLNSRVDTLRQFSEGYMDIRRRFFDVYKRDIKHLQGYQNTNPIQSGNSVAHDGDAVGDAFLFDHDKRTDRSLYRELYGLDADQVLRYHEINDDTSPPDVLNAYANLVVRGRIVGQGLKKAFRKFLLTVEESWEKKEGNIPDTDYSDFWYYYPKDPLVWKRPGDKG